ncbi:MAG: hypothetical protein MMC33_010490 [Icmadophila ericetorum]|nr:hypothetical protein [Icmadophila ericetorum]
MDISDLGLEEDILTGIRALSFDRATKAVIKFDKPWWAKFNIPNGGVSQSDLPINKPAVLMVSYSWAQGATHIGAFVPAYSKANPPKKDDAVLTLCLKNLAKLWSTVPGVYTYEDLQEVDLEHHTFAYNPWTADVFALFGRGQFKNMYPAFQKPQYDGKFYMCCEVSSAHHAWISGALDSTYMAVITWLQTNGWFEHQAKLKKS